MTFHQSIQTHLLSDARLYRPNPTFGNPPWDAAALRVLILRLSPFRDVEKSSTHLFLFREVRRAVPGSFIDMAFLPRARDRELLNGAGAPLILGTQSLRPLEDFTLVLASASCVPELVNLPFMLARSGIPRWSGERGEELPPIILGGSSAAAAHGLVREDGDCMADALFFGEGEDAVGRIAALWSAGTTGAGSTGKRGRLRLIADEVQGLWPAGDTGRAVKKAIAPKAPDALSTVPCPILPGEEAATAQLQITRGCPCLCSFCFEGHDRKPFRQASLERLSRSARALKSLCGADTLEISSFNFNTHDRILEILGETSPLFARVNAMSQRADVLASTPGLLEAETASGKRGFTIGVEGVSAAMRRFLHKSLEEADLKAVVERLHALSAREVKLFYILTGRETEDDFKELAGFAAWLRELRTRMDGGPRVIFSVGLLVRMPFTPLRHDGLVLDEALWRRLISRARAACGTFELRLASGVEEALLIQALALGDRWTGELVEELAAREVCYDSGFSPPAAEVLTSWIARHGDELSREKGAGHPFPLPFLDNPAESAFLHGQYLKARAGIDDGYCRRGEPGDCAGKKCAVCTLGRKKDGAAPAAHRTPALTRPRDTAAAKLADIAAAKTRIAPILLGVAIPEQWASSDGTWLSAVLLKSLAALGQGENVLWARENLVTPWLGPAFRGSWFGMGLVSAAAWDPEAAERAAVGAREGSGGSVDGPHFLPSPVKAHVKAPLFTSISLSMVIPRSPFPRAEEAIAAGLADMHTPFTAEKEEGWYRMVVSPKARGKKTLLDGRYRRGAEALEVELEAGPRLDLSVLLNRLPGGGSGIVVEVRGFTAI